MNKDHDFSNRQFLIADDKAFIRSLIQGMLRGFKVDNVQFATNGMDVLNTLSIPDNPIDCLLCDWNMAPINGLQVLSLIRRGAVKGAPRDLRVIMLTGHADAELVQAALALDVNGYVIKPVAAEKLGSAIADVFIKPFTLRSVEEYEEVKTGTVRNGAVDSAERTIPWVMWRRDPEKGQLLNNTLTTIRQEAALQVREKKPAARLPPSLNKRKCGLDEVKPGAILAKDILTQDGAVLLAAGVQLTPKLIERLKEAARTSETPTDLWIGDS